MAFSVLSDGTGIRLMELATGKATLDRNVVGDTDAACSEGKQLVFNSGRREAEAVVNAFPRWQRGRRSPL